MGYAQTRRTAIIKIENNIKSCKKRRINLHIPKLVYEMVSTLYVSPLMVKRHLQLMEESGKIKIVGDEVVYDVKKHNRMERVKEDERDDDVQDVQPELDKN